MCSDLRRLHFGRLVSTGQLVAFFSDPRSDLGDVDSVLLGQDGRRNVLLDNLEDDFLALLQRNVLGFGAAMVRNEVSFNIQQPGIDSSDVAQSYRT